VTRAVSEAAAQGDRSENAEYIYGKRRLREIDRRVRFLRGRLDGLKIVSAPPSDRGRVYFGAWVTLEEAGGSVRRHRIVGPDEFDREPGYISMDSPLGRTLLGKRAGDTIEVELPSGPLAVTITAIEY
jgi:transcription elongation factor GreB